MSTMSTSHHASLSPAQTAPKSENQRSVEADPGPWLAVTGPFLIGLTVAAVCWLSRISF